MDDAENALLSLEALPRLPTPEYAQRRKEAIGGTVLIYVIIILQTAVTLTCAFATPSMPEGVTHALAAVILSAAATAAISHAFVLFADLGIVKRSVRTCHPIPEEVANRIRSGVDDDFGPNVHNDGKSFCTRCLVWRPERSHHCRIILPAMCARLRPSLRHAWPLHHPAQHACLRLAAVDGSHRRSHHHGGGGARPSREAPGKIRCAMTHTTTGCPHSAGQLCPPS